MPKPCFALVFLSLFHWLAAAEPAPPGAKPVPQAETEDTEALLESAVEEASRAIAVNPADADGYGLRAVAYIELERFDLAWKDLEAAAQRHPNYAAVVRSIRESGGGVARAGREVVAPGVESYPEAEVAPRRQRWLRAGGAALLALFAGALFAAWRTPLWRARLVAIAGRLRAGFPKVDAHGPAAEADPGDARPARTLPRETLAALLPDRPPAPVAVVPPASPAYPPNPMFSESAQPAPGPTSPLPPGVGPALAPSPWGPASASAAAALAASGAPPSPALLALPALEFPGQFVGGKYQRVEIFRRGPLGPLWLAQDLSASASVLIKRVLPDGACVSPAEHLALLGTAKRVAALEHPGIVRTLEVLSEPGGPLLVYELLPAKPLDEFLRTSRGITGQELRWIFQCACDALAYADAMGLAHLNLKPSNILIPIDGAVKLVDFRIARPGPAKFAPDPYRAPEMAQGAAGTTADVYSLAACLRVMFMGRTAPSAAAQSLLARALSPHPEERPQDAAAFHAELAGLPELD